MLRKGHLGAVARSVKPRRDTHENHGLQTRRTDSKKANLSMNRCDIYFDICFGTNGDFGCPCYKKHVAVFRLLLERTEVSWVSDPHIHHFPPSLPVRWMEKWQGQSVPDICNRKFKNTIPKQSTGILLTEHKAESLICSFWYNIFGWHTAEITPTGLLT